MKSIHVKVTSAIPRSVKNESMHAVIKIVCFLVFGAAMAAGINSLLVAGFILVILLYLFEMGRGISAHLGTAMRMLKRLRWLFLSILIVYLFFTPGVLLWPGVLWGPTHEGLYQGLSRIAVLVLIVAAVNVLIASTKQDDFLSAVSWCLWPLSLLGLSHERLALRISMTLAAVGLLSAAYRHKGRDDAVPESSSPKLMTIAKTAHRLFAKVIDDAQQAPLREIMLPEQSRPPVLQWFIPVLLAMLLLAVKVVTADVG